MQTEAKKAGFVCLTALILSAIFSFGSLILSKVTGVFALYALSWQMLAGALIWAVLAVQFYQRFLAQREKLDMEQLALGSGDTIFESQKNHSELFAVAQNRLKIFEKWILPVFSVFIAVYQIVIGVFLVRYVLQGRPNQPMSHLLLGAVLMVSVAFLSFLFSLYATGLSSQQQSRPLRAAGSYLLATAILSFVCAAGLAFAQFKAPIVLTVLNWVVPILVFILGLETAFNFVLDIYRPRLQGQYSSSAFDSRLLAIIASPKNILQTAASTIDYQFGFKVSQTWFYKIMELAVVPLIIVSAAILYFSSCIVIIGPDSQAVIERFGSAFDSQGDVRLIGPGLKFKLPWPFGVTRQFPTKEIQEINIGYIPEDDPDKQKLPLLWGKEHYKEEYNLLVATEDISSQEKGAVPVSIIRAAIPVQYRVVDLYKYIYNHAESRKVLEALCYREVIKFAASSRIEPESEGKTDQESLLGAGRAKAASELVKIIQKESDRIGLGVEIVFMGLEGFHPPPEVAKDFQEVIGAVQKKQAAVLLAIAERDKVFTTNVGSVKQAEDLYNLADKYMQAEQNGDRKQTDKVKIELDNAFAQASGELFAKLRQAKSYSYERVTLAEATGKRFGQQLQAYKAAKKIYAHELKMNMFEESLEKIRKYIVVAEGDSQVTIIDLQEKLMPNLYDIEPVQGQ
jgi:regulator of protease activity HflC (stomatin/prohibitin superfamily)